MKYFSGSSGVALSVSCDIHFRQRWTMPIKNWSGAMNQFAIQFEGRVPMGGINSNSLTQNPV
jgi:transposase-like protein